jgi:heme exporter protein C
MKVPSLRANAIAATLVLPAGFALVFFYAPLDADQGFIQKIFYLHVPLAICSLAGFIVGGILAIAHLRTGDARWDARSYVAIHLSIIFGVGVLITGSIWARASWGKWWVWDEPTLVSFLIVFLLYATYYPLRYAIEDRDRQGRYASVFAITAGAFVPLNFVAVRMAQSLVHPRVFATANGGLPGSIASSSPPSPHLPACRGCGGRSTGKRTCPRRSRGSRPGCRQARPRRPDARAAAG